MSGPVELALARDLLESVAEEMAEACVRAAASPNIKDRRDLSAAVFDGRGVMVAHAAHIPVHLGAMPMGVRAALARGALEPGDVVLFNDPFEGGTHLPDVTALAGLFDGRGRVRFHLALRAHHADIGGAVPGSMAPQPNIHAEGVRIPPVRWIRRGVEDRDVTALLLANLRRPEERRADLLAKVAALRAGEARLRALSTTAGRSLTRRARDLVGYAGKIASATLRGARDGRGRADLPLGVLGVDGRPARIVAAITKRGPRLEVDFAGTTGPVGDGLNATRAVAHSAVYHLVRSLCPPDTPANDGLLASVTIRVPAGSLLDAPYPAPVASGNVETSQRLVDALWLAAGRLWPGRFPAPGSGTMANWTLGPAPGGPPFPSYYETVPGGAGAGPDGPGAAAIQQHMTNTRSTPVEIFEARWPVRVRRLAIRRGSGGRGRHRGGDGLVKELEVLAPAVFAWSMSRDVDPPPGAAGGGTGAPLRVAWRRGAVWRPLGPRGRVELRPGDRIRVETPGGGGFGRRS